MKYTHTQITELESMDHTQKKKKKSIATVLEKANTLNFLKHTLMLVILILNMSQELK